MLLALFLAAMDGGLSLPEVKVFRAETAPSMPDPGGVEIPQLAKSPATGTGTSQVRIKKTSPPVPAPVVPSTGIEIPEDCPIPVESSREALNSDDFIDVDEEVPPPTANSAAVAQDTGPNVDPDQ